MAMPDGAVGERGDEAATVEEAAGARCTGMSTASTTWGSSSEVGTEPVWPPPSPPWAMHRVDAPLGDLLGVALGADRSA